MAYVVTGSREGEQFTSSRHEIASAVYLARRLYEEGYDDVAITEDAGLPLSLDAFQQRHGPELRRLRSRRLSS